MTDNEQKNGVAILLTTSSWVALPYPKVGIRTAFVPGEAQNFQLLSDNAFPVFFKGKLFNKISAVLLSDYNNRLKYREITLGMFEIYLTGDNV